MNRLGIKPIRGNEARIGRFHQGQRAQSPASKAGYKTATCLAATTKSVLASREASIQRFMRRRGRSLPRAYSLSCTDSEWGRVRVLAERRGLSISRYMVECGLTVDPETEPVPPPRLVLDEAEQRALHDRVIAIAERTAPAEADDAVMTRVRNSLAFLVDEAMRTMIRDGREEELRGMLTELFGEDAAAATIDRVRARTSVENSDAA